MSEVKNRKWWLVQCEWRVSRHLAGRKNSKETTKVTLNEPLTSDHARSGRRQYNQQECIPVGCVPSTTVAVCWGVFALGGCLLMGGVPAHGGV